MSPATPPVTVTDYAAAAEARSFTGLEKGSVHTSDMWKSFTRNPAGAAWLSGFDTVAELKGITFCFPRRERRAAIKSFTDATFLFLF
ncbi:hypothetical protein F2P81_008242 [Scophthalmus maximus]|uniref:Uncharacterized protein n=1 Tax=Scophthalmus maximus TaxID=52904 RepID=A0A6A4T1R4_SCOMX|nr:hypothetical protein F2P81_008242 [Scophthalmus maximus]